MRNQIIIIVFSILILIIFLFIGFPLEIVNLTMDRIIFYVLSVILIIIFVYLFRLSLKLKKKSLKIFFTALLIPMFIVYSWIGLWTHLIGHSNGPIWEDTHIYTNKQEQKIISQFRETSGSIYDYRERLILYEFENGNRISIEWTKKRMSGLWKVNDIEKDTIYIEDFN